MKILVINGPNLNLLGKREKQHYGTKTLAEINDYLTKLSAKHNVQLLFYQSNHEGDLIDFIQREAPTAQGILINPGALTHYSFALRDTLESTLLPAIEVHLSNILQREPFRKIDVLDGVVLERVMGHKEQSYTIGLEKLIAALEGKK